MRVIIIGAGVVGYTIAEKFSREGQDIILIEKDEKRIKEVKESLDVRIIHGSGSSPQVLMEAGIEKADMVIAVTDSDEVNMIACLIADTQSKVPKKIARIRNPDYLEYTRIFEKDSLDLDLIINPEKVAAERILKIIEVPGAIDVMDFMEGRLKLVGCRLDSGSGLVGKKINDIRELYTDVDLIIASIYRGDETILPSGNTVLRPADIVFALTPPDTATRLVALFRRGEELPTNRCIIVGGGDVGYYLARPMEELGYQVKIIEKNEERCNFLAEKLDRTIVIAGDGTDRELLKEENIQETDTLVAVTDDEEANILTSLLAKRLGAKRAIALIDKPEYLSMVSTIGIDVAVSPRLASVSDILQFVRRGKVVSVKTLMGGRVEAIETIALKTSDIVDRPIKELKLPAGAVIGAIEREERVMLPDGDTVIRHGDRVLIFTHRKIVPKVEKILMVKPEYF